MPRLLLLALVLPLAACESPAPEVPGTPRAVGDLSETFVDAGSSEPLAVDSSELASASNEPSTDGPDWTPYEALRGWVGHSPVREDGTHFVLDPSVRPTIEEAFSVEPGLMAKLSHLDTEPSYLMEPVDFAGGAFALAFASNPATNDDARSLWMLIEAETGAVFALLADDRDTYYRASYDARVADLRPEAIAWVEHASGRPFGDLARMSEEAPVGP
ncbi:hypothetical protein B1759_09380 [Rubrivirga sp. SAORIC476]|uniref:hypothetical protein n=1 Tax=Rubrivirga sp. SAORIC476 TaxID=1961794 RepID=UPI000BA8FA8A|nr:hypothetical protein [Rubrivirga sp. SAORIC476]PAP81515.1 hypothetical protein B1759_09380 [Rubrivirga sp. SAORIC476]